MKSLALVFFLSLSLSAVAWEDHPDREDHKETDRIFKLAQKQTRTDEFEKLKGAPKEDVIAFCEENHFDYEEVKDVVR